MSRSKLVRVVVEVENRPGLGHSEKLVAEWIRKRLRTPRVRVRTWASATANLKRQHRRETGKLVLAAAARSKA